MERFFTALEMEVMVREAGLDVLKLVPLSMLQEELLPRNPDGTPVMTNGTPVYAENCRDVVTMIFAHRGKDAQFVLRAVPSIPLLRRGP